MSILDSLTKTKGAFNDEENCYRLSEIKAIANVEFQEVIPEQLYMAVARLSPISDLWLSVGAFEFYSQMMGEEEIYVQPLFIGEGPSGVLRELRHTTWGPQGDGYLFYPDAMRICTALQFLKKYYDLD